MTLNFSGGNDFGVRLCEIMGLNPVIVKSITIHVNSTDIVSVVFEMAMDDASLESFAEAAAELKLVEE